MFGPDAAQQKYLSFVSEARRGARNSRETPKTGVAARAGRRAAATKGWGAPRSAPLSPAPCHGTRGHWATTTAPAPIQWWRDGDPQSRTAKKTPMQPLRPANLWARATAQPQNTLFFGGKGRIRTPARLRAALALLSPGLCPGLTFLWGFSVGFFSLLFLPIPCAWLISASAKSFRQRSAFRRSISASSSSSPHRRCEPRGSHVPCS